MQEVEHEYNLNVFQLKGEMGRRDMSFYGRL